MARGRTSDHALGKCDAPGKMGKEMCPHCQRERAEKAEARCERLEAALESLRVEMAEVWHGNPRDLRTLPDALGMTQEEYEAWVTSRAALATPGEPTDGR